MGDKNTKVFHKSTNANRRYNLIEKLEINEIVQDKEIIKKRLLNTTANCTKRMRGGGLVSNLVVPD